MNIFAEFFFSGGARFIEGALFKLFYSEEGRFFEGRFFEGALVRDNTVRICYVRFLFDNFYPLNLERIAVACSSGFPLPASSRLLLARPTHALQCSRSF